MAIPATYRTSSLDCTARTSVSTAATKAMGGIANMRTIAPHESHRAVAKLIAELFKGQGTRYELAERTGLHRNYISRLLAAFKEEGCVYVIGWERDTTGRYAQAVFSLGFGDDIPRPPRQTQRERDAKRYRKMKEAKKVANIKTTFVGGSLWV